MGTVVSVSVMFYCTLQGCLSQGNRECLKFVVNQGLLKKPEMRLSAFVAYEAMDQWRFQSCQVAWPGRECLKFVVNQGLLKKPEMRLSAFVAYEAMDQWRFQSCQVAWPGRECLKFVVNQGLLKKPEMRLSAFVAYEAMDQWRFQSCQVAWPGDTHSGAAMFSARSNRHNSPEFYPGNAQVWNCLCHGLIW